MSNDLSGDGYSAEIAVSTHGVFHITATDWGSLGYGQGWGCGRDNLPVIADQIVKARGERARFHGNGARDDNIAGDFGYRVLDLSGRAPALRDAQPIWIRELVAGYVAGYNRAVAEADTSTYPLWCRDAEWIRQIDEVDLYTHIWNLTLMASGRNLVQLIGRAEPPGDDGPAPPSPIEALGGPPGASNGWAVGADVSAGGSGMVLANPHFPWYGEARFWECHLRIPGTYDVYGVSLLGTPGIQMGFNRSLGWTHTFSRGHRFTLATLELQSGEPTRYRHGDETRQMTAEDHTVEVRGDDGNLRTVKRTLWRSHHGPMLNMPLLGWSNEMGFTYRDANDANTAVLEQFLAMGMCHNVDELRRTFHEVKGMPWVNTMAADAAGEVFYTDASPIPRLSQEAQARFTVRVRDDIVAALLYDNRIAVLDGSDPDDDWQDHSDARSAGLEPPSSLPELRSRGIVVNANDSHWMGSPGVALEGFSVMAGLERTPRSLRTRQNLRLASALAERGEVTRDDLVGAVFDNASLSAELLREQVIERCAERIRSREPMVLAEGHVVDLSRVVAVLDAWDGRYDLDSRGAVLWREFMAGFPQSAWLDAGALWAVAFDPEDPMGTPHGLAPPPVSGEDPVLQAMGHGVRLMDAAGVSLDTALGEVQWAQRGDERVAVHGGGEGEGMLNVLAPSGALPIGSLEPVPPAPVQIPGRELSGLAEGGYRVTYGTSFLMALELTSDGPVAVGLLAYGQGCFPDDPLYVEGTRAYAAKAVRPLLFTDEEIGADPDLFRFTLQSSAE